MLHHTFLKDWVLHKESLLTISHFRHSSEEEEPDERMKPSLSRSASSLQYDALVVESVFFFIPSSFLCTNICTSTSKFLFHVSLALAHAHPAASWLLTAVYFCVPCGLCSKSTPYEVKIAGKAVLNQAKRKREYMHGSNLRTEPLSYPIDAQG